jgi:predicted RNA-binding protein with PIN domain
VSGTGCGAGDTLAQAALHGSAHSGTAEHAPPPEPEAEPPEALDRPLPEGVRRRVVGIAAEAFGALTYSELPSQLRQYARFTPARRAKFAATALAAALETDTVFRQRMAARLREAQPDLAEALDAGTVPAAADPLDVAAAAYLLRPPGWTKQVVAAGEEAERAQSERASEEVARELEQVKQELAEVRSSARAEAEKIRADLETARKESDALQRKLRSAVSDVRRGEAALRKVQAELDAVRAAAATERASADSEARRLRARLSETESALEANRRAVREGRSVEDMRLRLLLDTVLDAAQGLRRELALPPTTGRPADTVEAVAPGRMTPKDIARRALSEDDPALLDQLLALPQTHLVVDGYNVTKTGYPTMPLEKQRLRLLGGLSALAAQSGVEVTCVFDGADLEAPVLTAPARGVRVLFSKAGETADELIRRLVRAEPSGRPVVVVSTDREVADGVRKAGARPVASTLLLRRLTRG